MPSPIFKLSLPGIDVETASPEECVIHSSYPNPKINKHANPSHRSLISVTFNKTYPSGDTTIYTMAHGYSYTPMVWAVIADRTDQGIFGFQPYVSGNLAVEVKTDNKNMYIIIGN